MLDFLACQSLEKLVIDAEAIAWVKRLLAGIQLRTESLALEFYQDFKFKADFLKQRATRDLFRVEQHLPSAVIDRDSVRGWQSAGSTDTFTRARLRVRQLLDEYQQPAIDPGQETALRELVSSLASQAGMLELPI